MRIVMIGFPGVEYTIELTEALSELEDVLLMLPKPQAVRFKGIINANVNLYPFYYPRLRYPTNLLMIYKIIQKINKFKPDVIHIQRGQAWFNMALPLLLNYCLVTTIHDVILLDRPSQRIPAFTFRPPIIHASKLIVHGTKLKEAMVRLYKKSPEDVHVLRRGVNSIYTRYIEQTFDDNGLTVMYFGRIWGYKGLKYLIEAEPIITKKVPNAKIVIAGVGEDFSKYQDMMVNRENFIVYNKFIPHGMVAELFQKSSLIVLPYVNGSQSGVIPMAYAFKKPVVVTDVGSLPENVDHGITGFIVPPANKEKLANAIIDLLRKPKKRRKMGESAYRKTQNELSWKNIARKTVKVYEEALSD